ncbi:hypothetical protein AAVH_09124 [Aphelenchoides avenae]|nr:hypothetical protein AAVH_21731 [Aphelenchus avenae]KAH7723408.1 hypothetical protein AAVH_09124 [Aphelenchus avenae]
MPGYSNATVSVRPKTQGRYEYIEAETACTDLIATVVMAVNERNKGYLECKSLSVDSFGTSFSAPLCS